jgi:hypothetical protein
LIYESVTDFIAVDEESVCTEGSRCEGWYVLGQSKVFTTVSDSTIEIDVYVFSPEDIDLNSIFTVAWAIEYGQ